MSTLLYKEDFDEARDRMTAFSDDGDIGRPAVKITAPRPEPFEVPPPVDEPEGWITFYSTTNYEYRLNGNLRSGNKT